MIWPRNSALESIGIPFASAAIYSGLSGWIAAVNTTTSIPSIILYIAREEIISLSITESVLTFTLFIFILFRLLLTKRLPDIGICKEARLATEYNERRDEHITKFRTYYDAANAPAVTVTNAEDADEEKDADTGEDSDDNQETIDIDEYTFKSNVQNEEDKNEESEEDNSEEN